MRRGIASALLLFAACSGSERELGRAVREYDDALVRAYASADASRLPDVATAKEAARVQVLLDLKSNAKLVLERSRPSRSRALPRLAIPRPPRPGSDGATTTEA
jgi:hypothetical protein